MDGIRLQPPEWVAERFGVSRKRIYELAAHPDDPIPSYKIGRSIRFDETEVSEWIASHRKPRSSKPNRASS